MRIWSLVAGLLLLWPLAGQSQEPKVIVGDIVPPAVKAAAKAAAAQDELKEIKLEVGEFFAVEHKDTTPLLWQLCPKSDGSFDTVAASHISLIFVPANKEQTIIGKKAGEKEFKTHVIKSDKDTTLIVAFRQGSSLWMLFRNGQVMPGRTDILLVSVGGVKPDPDKPVNPPAVDDELTKTLRKAVEMDVVSGKGTNYKQVLLQLSGLFAQASEESLDEYKTLGEIYQNLLVAAANRMKIPDPDTVLTLTRDKVADELLASVQAGADQYTKPLTATSRAELKKAFARVSKALSTLAK